MRWDELFEELEAEFTAAASHVEEAEIAEMVHAEAATITLASRIRHLTGEELHLRLRNGETRRGILNEANHVWSMLHEGHRRYLIPHSAVSYAWPLGSAAPDQEGIVSALTLGYALRKIASAGIPVRILTDGGDLSGRITMVGADYCDVSTVTATISVPWQRIVSIEG